MSKFLIATMPITGHVTPMLSVARKLVERGHEVWWYAGSRFKAKVEATGARYVPYRAAYDYDDLKLNDAFPGRGELKSIAQFKFDMKHVFSDAGVGQVKDLEETLREFPADAILSDVAVVGPALLHEKGGPPCAVLGITAMTVASRDVAPFGLGILPSGSPLARVRNRMLNWLVNAVMFRDINTHHNKTRAAVGLPPAKKGFIAGSLSPFLFMQPTVPSFEYPRSDLAPQVHFIGPILPDAPASFTPPAWWDELRGHGRPVIHVTQGTSATDSEQLIVPALKALAGEDVLVVATTGGKPAESLNLNPLPANARVESFIPYYHLMPHVDLMITNGGYGGVQIALSQGVPLIVAGTTEDKPEIANRVQWSGAGINLKTSTPTPEQILQAVRRVMAEPGFRQRARQLQSEIAGYDAPALAAGLLEELAVTKQPVARPVAAQPKPRLVEA